MKKITSILCALTIVSLLLGTSAKALIIQSAPFSFPGTSFQNASISFDPWAGSAADLTQVLFIINGTVSGSFGIAASGPFTLNPPLQFQSYSFDAGSSAALPPPNLNANQPLATVPPTPGAFVGPTAFAVPSVALALSGTNDITAWKDYFIASNLIATNKVTLNIGSWLIINPLSQQGNASVVGGSMSSAGSVQVVFVPEPSTWALLVASAGVLAFGALRRRKS
jgi:hypothetical protein